MRVAVCIVGFRNLADVERCLAALAASDHADFEVVVCENGGEPAYDALREALAASPLPFPLRLIAAPNPGFAGGVNLCMAEAPGVDAWWVLNPDTVPEPQALSAMVRRLAVGDCQAVGGPVLLGPDRVQSWGGLWEVWRGRAVSLGYAADPADAPAAADIEARQNYLNGASMLVGRAFTDAVGRMREDYFLYCEEVEWCLRGLRAGLRLGYAADGVVLHFQGSSTGHATSVHDRSAMSVRLNERNRLLLTRDLYPARLPVVAVMALVVLVWRYGRTRAWPQLQAALKGWAQGLANQRGPQ